MTPESLVRHELVGLDVTVTDASNPDLVGISGRVRDETMRTLLVATSEGVKQVPKAGTTFRFSLDDCEVPRTSEDSEVPRTSEDSEVPRASEDSEVPRASEDSEAPRASDTSGQCPRAVLVDGDRLLARPALRTETRGGSLWQ